MKTSVFGKFPGRLSAGVSDSKKVSFLIDFIEESSENPSPDPTDNPPTFGLRLSRATRS